MRPLPPTLRQEPKSNMFLTVITKTQKEAIQIAKNIAKNNKSELVIHGTNGKMREKEKIKKVTEFISQTVNDVIHFGRYLKKHPTEPIRTRSGTLQYSKAMRPTI